MTEHLPIPTLTVPPGPFTVRKVVRFAHCDPAGIIYYPQYFMLAHDCKEDWFRDAVGYPFVQMVSRDRRGFPIIRLEADFMRPSRLGDELDFAVSVRAIGGASLKLDYDCTCHGEPRVRIRTVLVMTDLDAGTSVPIPDWLRTRLAHFMIPGQPAKEPQ